MTDENLKTQHPFAPRPADTRTARRGETDLERFLGGSPGAVLARLALLSLIVGFFLVWLDIRPMDVLFSLERFSIVSGPPGSTRCARWRAISRPARPLSCRSGWCCACSP